MKKETEQVRVVKSTYYSNWGDRIGYPLAKVLVQPLSKLDFVTPNGVTLTAFASFAIGSICLWVVFPHHLIIAAILIFAGYVGDDIDGQLARITGKSSVIGDYLDKVLDIFKIFFITFFAALSAFSQSGDVLYLLVGFIACFFFLLRYYIKLETMFSAYSHDKNYFEKSTKRRKEMEHEMDILYAKKASSLAESSKFFWIKNRTVLIVDEAEFAIFIAIGALVNQVGFALLLIAFGQVSWGLWRFYERGKQLSSHSSDLLRPMRK